VQFKWPFILYKYAHKSLGRSAIFKSSELPIYFKNPDNRKQRHEQWQQIVKDDEVWWDEIQNPNGPSSTNKGSSSSDWDSSKSAVLGLATNYGKNVYERAYSMLFYYTINT
jgi:hypothetical protein